MKLFKSFLYAMPGLLLAMGSTAVADETFPTPKKRFGLGLVVNTQSPEYKGHDEATLALFPFYRGDRVTVDHNELSFNFTPEKSIALEVLAKQQHHGYDSSNSKVFSGMQDRHAIWGLGGRATASADWGEVALGAYFNPIDDDDVPGADSGASAELSYGYPLTAGVFQITPTVGYSWYSSEVVDFLYGVSAADATRTRKAFKGDDAGIAYIGVNLDGMVSENVRVMGGLRYESLPDEISDSPLVDDDKTFRAHVGVAWLF